MTKFDTLMTVLTQISGPLCCNVPSENGTINIIRTIRGEWIGPPDLESVSFKASNGNIKMILRYEDRRESFKFSFEQALDFLILESVTCYNHLRKCHGNCANIAWSLIEELGWWEANRTPQGYCFRTLKEVIDLRLQEDLILLTSKHLQFSFETFDVLGRNEIVVDGKRFYLG